MSDKKWLMCPQCNNKTRIKIRDDTELKRFPLYCPKCRNETLIDLIHRVEQNFDLLIRLYNKQCYSACLNTIYCYSILQNPRFAQPFLIQGNITIIKEPDAQTQSR